MTALRPINSRPESLTEMVYEAIREAIVSWDLGPGDRVTEASLAKQLNVSKTPVREALLKLQYVGLIEPDGRRGMRVPTPSNDRIRSAYELRTALECQAVRLVTTRLSENALDRLKDIADTCLSAAEAGDRDGFRAHDRRFHLAIAEASQNDALARLIRDVFDLTWTLRRRDAPAADDSLECAKQHVRVVDAIAAQDDERADSEMREHLSKVQNCVLATLDQQRH